MKQFLIIILTIMIIFSSCQQTNEENGSDISTPLESNQKEYNKLIKTYSDQYGNPQIGGKEIFVAQEDNKEFIVHGGVEGPKYDQITTYYDIGDKVAYIVSQKGKYFVVFDGIEGKKYDNIFQIPPDRSFRVGGPDKIKNIGDLPTYIIQEGEMYFYVHGQKEGKRYSSLSFTSFQVGDGIAYTVEINGSYAVVVNGIEYTNVIGCEDTDPVLHSAGYTCIFETGSEKSKSYQIINLDNSNYNPLIYFTTKNNYVGFNKNTGEKMILKKDIEIDSTFYLGNKLVMVETIDDKSRINVGDKVGNFYTTINKIYIYNDSIIYSAKEEDKQMLIIDNEVSNAYDYFVNVFELEGNIIFIGSIDEKKYVVFNDHTYGPYDEIRYGTNKKEGIFILNGKLVFLAEKSGKLFFVEDGIEHKKYDDINIFSIYHDNGVLSYDAWIGNRYLSNNAQKVHVSNGEENYI